MIIEVSTSKWKYSISQSSVKKAVQKLLLHEGVRCDWIAIHFVDEKKIKKLHQQFFSDPTITDCITFPIDPMGPNCHYLGEIFICPEVAEEYASSHEIPLQEELTLYLIHGILHLLEYDDIDPKDREIMRKKEKSCMELLKKDNALLRIYS